MKKSNERNHCNSPNSFLTSNNSLDKENPEDTSNNSENSNQQKNNDNNVKNKIKYKQNDTNLSLLVNSQDIAKTTPLHYVCSRTSESGLKRLRILLENGADIFNYDEEGDSCLHIICVHGNLELLQTLIKFIQTEFTANEAKRFINHKGRRGMTALHVAGVHGHAGCLNVLLRNSADVASIDDRNRSIFHAVAYSGCVQSFNTIQSYVKKLVKPEHVKNLNNSPRGSVDSDVSNDSDESGNVSDEEMAEKLDLQREMKVKSMINHVDCNRISPVHMAAWTASSLALDWLLKKNASVNGPPDYKGRTPLHYASLNDKHGDCLQILINHDAELMAKDNHNFNPFHWAARTGQSHNIEQLIAKTSNVIYTPDSEGITSSKQFSPLHLAARYGHHSSVEQLESLVVDPDIMDENNCTPLWYACKYGHEEAAVCLINAGAAAFPLDYTKNESMVDKIDLDDDVMLDNTHENDGDRTSLTKLSEMPTYPLHECARNGNYGLGRAHFLLRILGELLEIIQDQSGTNLVDGASIDCKDRLATGETPLMLAILHNHLECVKMLLDKDAKITCPDNFGRTALHRSIIPTEQQIVMELFQNPIASTLTQDENGLTPFHLAALDKESGHCLLNIMMHISDAATTGAAFIPDSRGFTPLHYAATIGNLDFVEQFINFASGANSPAYYMNSVEDIGMKSNNQVLLDLTLGIFRTRKDPSINRNGDSDDDDDDIDPQAEIELLERIQDQKIYTQLYKFNKFSPLHCAALNDHDQIIEQFLKYFESSIEEDQDIFNIEIDLKDSFGRLPLHVACMAFQAAQDTCEHLIVSAKEENGLASARFMKEVANVNAQDKFGKTPGMIAARFNNVSCLGFGL